MSVLELLEEDLEAEAPLARGSLYQTYISWCFSGINTIHTHLGTPHKHVRTCTRPYIHMHATPLTKKYTHSKLITASKTVPRFLKNTVAMDKFLDIALKYPPLTANGPRNEVASGEPGKCDVGVPTIISLHHTMQRVKVMNKKVYSLM
jgi:hypothetical protein